MQRHFEKKLQEVFYVEPNDLGFPLLTNLYHMFTSYLKKMPFVFVLPLSFVTAALLSIGLGSLLVRLVSILQYGF